MTLDQLVCTLNPSSSLLTKHLCSRIIEWKMTRPYKTILTYLFPKKKQFGKSKGTLCFVPATLKTFDYFELDLVFTEVVKAVLCTVWTMTQPHLVLTINTGHLHRSQGHSDLFTEISTVCCVTLLRGHTSRHLTVIYCF